MRKIGTLTCLLSNRVCARASCMKAFNNREAYFNSYPADTQLAALMTCNGCSSITEADPSDDKGIQEKIQRLKKEGVDTVHVGICTVMRNGKACGRITTIRRMLEDAGIHTVDGTHFMHSPPKPKGQQTHPDKA